MPEREYTDPVDECEGRSRLNPAARGWSRQPLLRANLRGAWGRKKRWDYWNVNTPEIVVSVVYADIDYAGTAAVWIMEHGTGWQAGRGRMVPLARGLAMPELVCRGAVAHVAEGFSLRIAETSTHTELQATVASSPRGPIEVDLRVAKPAGHESLNVMVPWSSRRFQFTSKHNTRPAAGTVSVGDRHWAVGDDAWGVQDLGRGIWPFRMRWNWAAASGHSADGRVVGLQFGGKWTEGTGATENGLCVGGRLTKISDELVWEYSWEDPMKPWRVRTPHDDRVDVELRPTFDRYDCTDLKLLKMEVHQVFGTWHGAVRDADGALHTIDGVRGFAEEARNRW